MNRITKLGVLAAIAWLALHPEGGKAIPQQFRSPKSPTAQESTLLRAIESDPDSIPALTALSDYYQQQKKWRDSVRYLTKAYALSGGKDTIGYNLALAQVQAGDLEGARKLIQEMLAKADSAKLHNLLGTVEEDRADYLAAAKEYHQAAELEPSEQYIFDLATFLLQHKQYEGFTQESLKFFRYGVSKFPNSSPMLVGLGVALYASDAYDEAVRVLCAAVDMDTNDRRPLEFLGKVRKVSPELADQVDQRLKGFAERYPENAASNYYYAFSLWQRGGGEEGKRLDEIERLLRKAVIRAPEWYEPHYLLGTVYDSEKRNQEALRELQRVVKIEPGYSPAHFRLAVLYSRTGDKAKAMEEASIAKKLKDAQRDSEMVEEIEK